MINKLECSICKYDKYVGSLHIHHIDGNHQNNNIDNLIVLCANCHFEHHHTNKSTYKKNRTKSKEELIEIIKGHERAIQQLSKESLLLQKLYPVQWQEIMNLVYPNGV